MRWIPKVMVWGSLALAGVACREGTASLVPSSDARPAYVASSNDQDPIFTPADDEDLIALTDPGASVSKSLPDWAKYPEEMPQGLRGRNNCTFPIASGSQWNFHEDGSCWERPGPDGWTRQQQHNVHVPHLPLCGNGPADIGSIRICRGPGQPSPCANNPRTGPNGCAVCVPSIACY